MEAFQQLGIQNGFLHKQHAVVSLMNVFPIL
jgi:hypothetical protein